MNHSTGCTSKCPIQNGSNIYIYIPMYSRSVKDFEIAALLFHPHIFFLDKIHLDTNKCCPAVGHDYHQRCKGGLCVTLSWDSLAINRLTNQLKSPQQLQTKHRYGYKHIVYITRVYIFQCFQSDSFIPAQNCPYFVKQIILFIRASEDLHLLSPK